MPEMIRKGPAQQTDPDHANDDFAALFSAPVLIPQIELTKKQEPDNADELNGSVASLADQIETSAIPQTFGTGNTTISMLPAAAEGSVDSTIKTATTNPERPANGRFDYGLQVFSTKRQITNFEVTTSLRRKLSPPLLAAGIAQLERKHLGPTGLPIRRDNASFEVMGESDLAPSNHLNAEVFLEQSKLKIAEIPRVPASSDPNILEVSQQKPETTVSNIVETDSLIPASPRLFAVTTQPQIKPEVLIAPSSDRPIPTDKSIDLVPNEREILSDIKQIVGSNKQTFQLDVATEIGEPLQYLTLPGDDANRFSLPDSNLADPAQQKPANILPIEFGATTNMSMDAHTIDPETLEATVGSVQMENAPATIGKRVDSVSSETLWAGNPQPSAKPQKPITSSDQNFIVEQFSADILKPASIEPYRLAHTAEADISPFASQSTEKEIKPETLWAGFDLPGAKPQKPSVTERSKLNVPPFTADVSKPAFSDPSSQAIPFQKEQTIPATNNLNVVTAAKVLNFARLSNTGDRPDHELPAVDVSPENATERFISMSGHSGDSAAATISLALPGDDKKLAKLPSPAAESALPFSVRTLPVPVENASSKTVLSTPIAGELDSGVRTSDGSSNPETIAAVQFTRPEKIERAKLAASGFSEIVGTIPSFASVLKEQTAGKIETPDQANVKVLEQLQSAITHITQMPAAVNEKRTLKMRLNPEELGSVEITIQKSSTGKITAHFQTESESTRQILQQGLEHLRTTLESIGSQVGDLKISCGSFTSNGNESSGNKPQQFGSSESPSQGASSSDGVLNPEDDPTDHLVSLRA